MWKRSSLALCIAALTIASIFAGAGTYAYYSGEPFTIDFSNTPEPVISGLSPGYVAGILIVILAAAALVYAYWKGMLPPPFPSTRTGE